MRSKKPSGTLFRERQSDLRPWRVRRHPSLRAPAERQPGPVLTPRQRDVAALLVGTGLSYKQIAAHLDLSEGTIRTHTERIYRAFGVHSRPELTVAFPTLAIGLPPEPPN